jgi:hypothetical protein
MMNNAMRSVLAKLKDHMEERYRCEDRIKMDLE